MAESIRIFRNPSDPESGYILWSDGHWDTFGNAIPINGSQQWPNWVPPAGLVGPCRAGVIINWNAPSGYVMDWEGTVYAFGGATAPPAQITPKQVFYTASDMVADPAGNGRGYVLTMGNDVLPFGGQPGIAQPPKLNVNVGNLAIRFYVNWNTGQYYTMTNWAAIYAVNGAVGINKIDPYPINPGDWIWPYTNYGRAMYVKDWATGQAWLLDSHGIVHSLNNAPPVFGGPDWSPYGELARDFCVLYDGSDPMHPAQFYVITFGGWGQRFQVSTNPSAAIITPTGNITLTTRPRIGWSYSDAEYNAQRCFRVRIFTQAQYSIGGFDPSTSPSTADSGNVYDSTRFYWDPDVDIPNGTYRAYIFVEDTSQLWSSGAFSQFVMAVVPPPQPTIQAVYQSALSGIVLSAHVNAPPASSKIGIQYRDNINDPWRWVRNGDALVPDGGGNVTINDYEARIGVTRTYQALCYKSDNAGNLMVGVPSATGSATITDKTQWILSNPSNPAQAFVVKLADFSYTKPVKFGIVQPVGRNNPIINTDGKPKGIAASLKIWALNNATRIALEAALDADVILYLRDPMGRGFYFRPINDPQWDMMRARPIGGETTPIRDMHQITVPMQEVDRPFSGPTSGLLAILV